MQAGGLGRARGEEEEEDDDDEEVLIYINAVGLRKRAVLLGGGVNE
jgi:hypothetical protein